MATTVSQKDKRRAEDKSFYRILAGFGAAAAVETLLIILYRLYSGGGSAETALKVAHVVFFALLLGTVAAGLLTKKKYVSTAVLAGGAILWALLGVACVFAWRYGTAAVGVMCIVCPAIAVAAMVYIVYQREFFYEIVVSGLGILALVVTRRWQEFAPRLCMLLLIAALAAAVVLTLVTMFAARNKGKVFGIAIYSSKTVGAVSVYIASGLTAAGAVGAMLLGKTFMLTAALVLAAFIFVDAVYHTVKLI